MSEYFEKARKLEGRVASDQDLKTSDLLRYYVRDTDAAKNLLYRRARCLADYENANKALDKARVKGKEVAAVSTCTCSCIMKSAQEIHVICNLWLKVDSHLQAITNDNFRKSDLPCKV